jgi:hypothetical protein
MDLSGLMIFQHINFVSTSDMFKALNPAGV